ncbi:MAG TPA: hypothetical protein VF815_18575 [Myxococcaceae bacterium]|jgi:hypothetical protein
MEETLEDARVAIRHLLAEESYNQQRIGELYNHVAANRLAEAAGYRDALEYFSQHVRELPRALLMRYAAVASTFSAETCARYGITSLSMLLTYARTAGVAVNPDDPGMTPIPVPDAEGRVRVRPFARCSEEELREVLLTQQALPQATALPGR